MATPAEIASLWTAAHPKTQDNVILSLIAKHPELLNAKREKDGKSLVQVLMTATKKPSLKTWEIIILSPKLDFDAKNNAGKSNRQDFVALIQQGVFDILIKNQKFLVGNDVYLAFTDVHSRLTNAIEGCQAYQKRNESIPVENQERMIRILKEQNIIRDATIKLAISTDNPSIMGALIRAGNEPLDALSDGKLPAKLAKKGSKMAEWCKGRAEALERHEKIGMFAIEQEQATANYEKQKANILQKAADDRIKNLGKMTQK